MISGAPSESEHLNQFVSAEYHLLQMIFCRTIISINSTSPSLLVPLCRGCCLCPGLSVGMPLPAQLRGGLSIRERLSKPRLPVAMCDPISAASFLDRAPSPSHGTQAVSWSQMMDPGFLLNLVPPGFLGLSLYIFLFLHLSLVT